MGIRSGATATGSLVVAEAQFSQSAGLRVPSSVLDLPKSSLRIQPGLVEISELPARSGTILVHLTVPQGTEVVLDDGQAPIARFRAGNALIQNGVLEPVDAGNFARMLTHVMTPKNSVRTLELLPLREGRFLATAARLSANLHKFVKPRLTASVKPGSTALLRVRVDTEGSVTDVMPGRGDAALLQAAEMAMRQWQFEPFAIQGKPVPVEGTVTFFIDSDGSVHCSLLR